MNRFVAITCMSALAIASALPACATAGASSKVPPSTVPAQIANQALLGAAEIFENLSESARAATQAQFDAAMADYGRHAAGINAVLTPEAGRSLAQIIQALKTGWAKGNRTDVALYSIEAYRLLVQGVSRTSGGLPVEVALLDYSGFKLSALAQSPSPNWKMIDATAAEAAKWWRVIAPKVHDQDLKQAMQRTIDAYADARKTSNVALLAYAADMDLILVDALEADLKQGKVR